MMCPHSLKASPADCSQCLHAPVRRIHVVDHVLCIDGVPTDRTYDHERVITARKTRKR